MRLKKKKAIKKGHKPMLGMCVSCGQSEQGLLWDLTCPDRGVRGRSKEVIGWRSCKTVNQAEAAALTKA